MKQLLFKLIISVVLTTGPVYAGSIPEIDCLIEPKTEVKLSSPVSGVLDTIRVDRSDVVKKNQIVATLKSDIEELNVKTSAENLKMSKKEHQRTIELYREKAITLSEKDEADHQKNLYELELKNAKANLALRQIRSPIDGVVVDRYKMPGEHVEDKPILKIAQLDPLRVEVVSSVENFGLIKKGMHATIIPEYGTFDDLIAEIVVVDQVIDAASGTFGIRLELQNKGNKVPGGLKCKVRFFSEEEDASYIKKISDNKLAVNHAGSTENLNAVDEEDVPDNIIKICSNIGPFSDREKLLQLISELAGDIISSVIREENVEKRSYLLTTESFNTLDDAKQRVSEIHQKGMTDTAIMSRSRNEFVISLGLFSSMQGAKMQQARLKNLDIQSTILPRSKNKTVHWAVIVSTLSGQELVGLMSSLEGKTDPALSYRSCSE